MKKVLVLLSVVLFSTSLVAQNLDPKPGREAATAGDVTDLKLASELVRYGYSERSALALANALEIYNEISTRDMQATEKGDAVDAAATQDKSNISFNFNEVLAQAKEFAQGDKHLSAMLNTIEADAKKNGAGTRGASNGPIYHTDRVNANTTDSYSIRFDGSERAEVVVIGDGDTDLDLYVYDENGNLIDSDLDLSDNCVASWTPKWTGKFTIKIKNRGNVYNNYVLITN